MPAGRAGPGGGRRLDLRRDHRADAAADPAVRGADRLAHQAQTQRQWRLLARLGGHFLDVVEGLPTLSVFGRARAQEQVIAESPADYRKTTMATLRVAFLSALVLELAAALATALVAVEVGLRLLGGHLGYQTALLVLLLTPEAFLPLRAAAPSSTPAWRGGRGRARVRGPRHRRCPPAEARPGRRPRARRRRTCGAELTLDGMTLTYPGRPARAGRDQPDHRTR